MKTDGNLVKSPTPPLNRPHTDTADHQADFAAISAKTPVDEEFRTAFRRNKLLIARTHPRFDIAARDQAVASLLDRLGRGGGGDGDPATPRWRRRGLLL